MMELQLLFQVRALSSSRIGRGTRFLATLLGLTAVLFAGQGICQTRIAGKSADQAPAAMASEQTLVSSSWLASSGEAEEQFSAPSPQIEEADLARPSALFSFYAAQQSGQSSSQSGTQSSSQDASAATTSSKAAAARSKPPHHGLGIALAAVGTTALVLGAVSYSLGHIDICSNQHGGGCQEARVAGLVLMPAGGAVAITGFYLQFHR